MVFSNEGLVPSKSWNKYARTLATTDEAHTSGVEAEWRSVHSLVCECDAEEDPDGLILHRLTQSIQSISIICEVTIGGRCLETKSGMEKPVSFLP